MSSHTINKSSRTKQDKCPTSALKKFKKHETVNLIRLKETAKKNSPDANQNENTEEAIKKAEKDLFMNEKNSNCNGRGKFSCTTKIFLSTFELLGLYEKISNCNGRGKFSCTTKIFYQLWDSPKHNVY